MPVIWGPSYASGAALEGTTGQIDYAAELKNASLSSPPERWSATSTNWRDPTVSGRLGYRPDEMWNLGFSASAGSYLSPAAKPTLPAGYNLDDYREIVLGQDAGFAWHYWQIWAECYETRFAIPLVGQADTLAYYLEAKYKITPQLFGALRWNQQFFSTLPDGADGPVRWGRDIWRVDVAPGYRFTPHTELKIQYSIQHESLASRWLSQMFAVQFTVRF
jgi:predicted porin